RKCIETVIKDTGFELCLQPIVDAATGKVVGAEALSRIRDEEGNIIAPGIFIPVAENSGRINELGELVFDEACRFIKENDPGKRGVNWINVNLSPTQFIRTDLAERYASIVDKYGIDPESVHLEITEGSMIDDCFSQWQIDAMTKKGFKFVLDDYGTGYSNLSRLKKCPLTTIKLDMSIVWDYCKEPDEILPNMIQAFKYMGFAITAEGIEDTNMVNTMKDIGCDLLQGYYYSMPVPAVEFAKKYLK
ncbi:MAG: EAL domain-containing protein, partial [Lachnospiraceae bacterium]|nr:EAL domain-containing protein [Lachnospiraceae bacterium]